MLGKLDPEDLANFVFARTGASDEDVVMGPQYGEDAAAIRFGDRLLVASSDPLSLAEERLGTLAVNVACNDVATCGADPRWLTNVVFLPDDDPETLDVLTSQIDAEAERLGVAIVGGHSEYVPALERPMVSMTALGVADEYVPTGGAEPGDRILLTKGAAVEGTAILATDFRDEIDLPADVFERAESFFGDISVVPESAVLAPRATAMHDPTEGGVLNGLVEMATASRVEMEVERSAVPVREETTALCEAMDVDPLRIFGSGALLAAVPEAASDDALAALDDEGIEAAEIGRVSEVEEREPADGESDAGAADGVGGPGVRLDGELYRDGVRDDLYELWE